jgi:nitrite reductase (NO-forming)
MLFTIAAVAVMGATLFGSTYTNTQISGQGLDVNKLDVDVLEQIHQMGGLQLVMPQAFAETDCGKKELFLLGGLKLTPWVSSL